MFHGCVLLPYFVTPNSICGRKSLPRPASRRPPSRGIFDLAAENPTPRPKGLSRKRESRGGGWAARRCSPAQPPLDSRFRGNDGVWGSVPGPPHANPDRRSRVLTQPASRDRGHVSTQSSKVPLVRGGVAFADSGSRRYAPPPLRLGAAGDTLLGVGWEAPMAGRGLPAKPYWWMKPGGVG